jgi:hypothetical protein
MILDRCLFLYWCFMLCRYSLFLGPSSTLLDYRRFDKRLRLRRRRNVRLATAFLVLPRVFDNGLFSLRFCGTSTLLWWLNSGFDCIGSGRATPLER